MSISAGYLETKSLMELCLVAQRWTVSIDDCETKTAVIHALMSSGTVVQDGVGAVGAADQLAPAHGAALGLNRVKSELVPGTGPKRRKTTAATNPTEAASTSTYSVAKLEGTDDPAEPILTAMTNTTILRRLVRFVPHKQFLFFAPVARAWRAAWDPRLTVTAEITPESTVAQLRDSFDGGLPRGRSSFTCALARLGRLELLRFAQENYGFSANKKICAAAAGAGHLEVLRWLVIQSGSWDRTTCTAAAMNGRLGVLRWARRHGCPWDETTCAAAARGGHLLTLRWALRHGCPFDETLCAGAAEGGHLSILRGARKRHFPWDTRTCVAAAKTGNMHVLKWAVRNGCPWSKKTCTAAACAGNLIALQWVRKRGCPWSSCTCAAAAQEGHLSVLQWARRSGCNWRESTCIVAARGGHLPVLKWARENGCPWSVKTCAAAAETGNLAVLQWARENGCPWDEATCLRAAGRGHVDVLRWARENGCPWQMDACLNKAEGAGHESVVVWILSNLPQDAMDGSSRSEDGDSSGKGLRNEGGVSVQVAPRDAGDELSVGGEGGETHG